MCTGAGWGGLGRQNTHNFSSGGPSETGEGGLFRNIPFPQIKAVRIPSHVVRERLLRVVPVAIKTM